MEELMKQYMSKVNENNDLLKVQNAELKKQTELLSSQSGAALHVHDADGGSGSEAEPSQPHTTSRRVLSPADVHKTKVAQLHQLLRKSHKVKDFKDSGTENIKKWLVEFEEELNSQAILSCNLDLETKPLSDIEYVNLLKDKLSSYARKEIQQAFEARSDPLTWRTVTKKQFRDILL